MNNALYGLEDTFDMEHNLVDTPLEGCQDVFMHEGSYSLACDHVLPSSLEHSHVSTFCSQPSFSSDYPYDVPIDNFEICDSNVDMGWQITCSICLVGMLKLLSPYITLVGIMPALIHIA